VPRRDHKGERSLTAASRALEHGADARIAQAPVNGDGILGAAYHPLDGK
jgi:hypothetical protein